MDETWRTPVDKSSRSRGWFPFALVAGCGVGVGIAIGLAVASIGNTSQVKTTVETKALSTEFRKAVSEAEMLRSDLAKVQNENGKLRNLVKELHRAGGDENLQAEAKAQLWAFRNWMPKDAAERESLEKSIMDIFVETGASESDLYSRLAITVASRGNLEKQAALDAVRVSALLVSENPILGIKLAKGLIVIQMLGGGTANQVAGQLIATADLPGVNGLDNVIEHGIPVVVEGLKNGTASPQESLAMWATLLNGIREQEAAKRNPASTKLDKDAGGKEPAHKIAAPPQPERPAFDDPPPVNGKNGRAPAGLGTMPFVALSGGASLSSLGLRGR